MDNSRLKFRAWHNDAKDMVFFGLGEDHLKAYSIEEEVNYTLDLDHGHPVMQFTGLLDKNGVEIYEGDILNWKDHYIEVRWGSVGWILKGPMFSKFGVGKKIAQCSEVNTGGYTHASEVIGNVHQNPELLT